MLLRTALALAAKNIAVFPCAPGQKTPACAHGVKEATTDVIVIRAWWSENSSYNIGVATGSISGIFVVDVDGAEAALAALGELPKTVEALTARGRHLYFRLPSGTKIRNSAGKLGPGLDIRAESGYVLAPPSVHPDGPTYRWNGGSSIALPPQWLLDKLAAIGGNGHAAPASEWRQLVTEGVDEGQRDVSATRLAGYLLRRYLDPGVVRELVGCWNELRCRPSLPPEDIDRIVNSIASREQGKRNGSG
jgi:hypothetical protein